MFNLQTNEEWQIVFMISAAVYLFGCVVYWFWASGEIQPWALKQTEPVKDNGNSNKPKPDAVTYVGYANEGLEMGE